MYISTYFNQPIKNTIIFVPSFSKMERRLTFSNSTPNDQDGIIPNNVIILDRYSKNPVLLKEHRWGDDPLGILTDIRIVDGRYSAIPVFHMETQASREAAGMYEKGALKGASIGGAALWKKNPVTDEYVRDEQGYKICEAFYLYEVSLVSIPSNPDAVAETFHSFIYEDTGLLEEMDRAITTLSSKFKIMPQTATAAATEPAKPVSTASPAAATTGDGAEPVILSSKGGEPDQLPGVIKQIIKDGGSITFSAVPKAKDEPTSTQGDKTNGDPQPDPIGLAAKEKLKAGKKLLKAIDRADKAIALFKKKKDEADDKPDDEEMKSKLSKLRTDAELASKECAEAEEDYEKACEAADEEEKEKKSGKVTTTLGATGAAHINPDAGKPTMLSADDIAQKLNLAAAPSFKGKVGLASQGVTFTKLNSSKADVNDQKILKRLFNTDKAETVDLSVHAVVLNSMLNDTRLRPITSKVRAMPGVSLEQMQTMIANPVVEDDKRPGLTLQKLAADLASGRATYKNRSTGEMEAMTFLTSTDNALASPALNTIEWLSLAIFELFPTTSWKSNIPMFGASMASANTGFIWANVTATPAVYKGTSPAPAADYTYTDQAVALSLTPYWLQPMLWNPLTMHQLRYDQQSTGWAQAFAEWNAVIDDNLIYTLASTVPASAVVPTSGLSGYQTAAQNFPVGVGGNTFYWNNAYAGNLANPVLNDILAIEQIYRNQNFQLSREKAVLVLDSIGERYLCQDPETKTMLTRFISANQEEFVGYKHTIFDVRSRVAMYDTATKQVKDINAAMPATAVSAMLGFIPSQVGMGIGMLDVYMVQDPANYGYRMSADIRIGIVPLRFNFYGTTLYVFAVGNV